MNYFPLFADLRKQPCLVVGGGDVGLRKARQLLRAGALVTVNAPVLADGFAALDGQERLHHAARDFDPALVAQHLLVIAATGDTAVNQAVADASRACQRLCNVVDNGPSSTFIVPSVVDRSPVIVAVGSSGQAPMLARILRQRIDELLPARIGALANWVGRWRERVAARIVTHEARVQFWQSVLDGPIADAVLAGQMDAADAQMTAARDGAQATAAGEAWLVGAGPGDPELITRRGLQLLQRADAVLHDFLIPPALLDYARRDADVVCVGKRGGGAAVDQADINRELLARVKAGQRVCRLKGGDPFIFGRGGEEIEALADAGLRYEIVPGITAASGCSAYAGIPLTHRELADGVSFVTGHRAEGRPDPDWQALVRSGHTLVIYMGARRLGEICGALRENGCNDAMPAALIENGTTEHQRVTAATLADLPARAAAAGVATPALLVIGKVAALADRLHWRDLPATPMSAAV